MIIVKKKKVKRAFVEFDENGAPPHYSKPKRYWVRNPKNGKLYPQKTIYGMANGLPQNECDSATNTRKALVEAGFEIIDAKEEIEAQAKLYKRVQKRVRKSSKDRQRRLAAAEPQPSSKGVYVFRYDRNPDVIAERLHIANGHCEECSQPAPFNRASDGTPFLEVHHVVPLADQGSDTVKNTRALCPNCHRKAHFG